MNRYGLRAAAVALAVPVVVLAGYPASASSASWSISGCRLDKSSSPALYGLVTVANKDPNNEHDYSFDVEFDKGGTRLGTGSTTVSSVRSLETGKSDTNNAIVADPSKSASQFPEGPVDCKVTKVTDENNATVTRA
jgi:hypothetical protein